MGSQRGIFILFVVNAMCLAISLVLILIWAVILATPPEIINKRCYGKSCNFRLGQAGLVVTRIYPVVTKANIMQNYLKPLSNRYRIIQFIQRKLLAPRLDLLPMVICFLFIQVLGVL